MQSKCTQNKISLCRQQGSALLVCLIFLLVLTVLGLSSLNDTLIQNKMSGAMQDSNVALQTVELASREAEQDVESLIEPTAGFSATGPFYSVGNAPADIFDDSLWSGTRTKEGGAAIPDSGFPKPRYLIENLGTMKAQNRATSLVISNVTHETGEGDVYGFRIVARSTGATGTSQRIVETYYGKRF